MEAIYNLVEDMPVLWPWTAKKFSLQVGIWKAKIEEFDGALK